MLDPPPVEVAQLIERRKRLGLDLYDEIWEGVYHLTAARRVATGTGSCVSFAASTGRPAAFRPPALLLGT